MEKIITFFLQISRQDGVLLGIFLGVFFVSLLVPLRRLYQAYLGIIVGFFLFIFLNLSLGSLSEVIETSSPWHKWLAEHKKALSVWSMILIPFLGVVMAINRHITLKVPESKGEYFLFKLLLSILLFPFLCTLVHAILENGFFFTLAPEILASLKKMPIFILFEHLGKGSVFFLYILSHGTLINLSVMLFIVYKMTFWGIVEYIFAKILASMKMLSDKIPREEKGNGEKKE